MRIHTLLYINIITHYYYYYYFEHLYISALYSCTYSCLMPFISRSEKPPSRKWINNTVWRLQSDFLMQITYFTWFYRVFLASWVLPCKRILVYLRTIIQINTLNITLIRPQVQIPMSMCSYKIYFIFFLFSR